MRLLPIYTFLFSFILVGAQNSNDVSPEEEASKLLKKSIADEMFIGAAAGFSIDGETKWVSASGYADLKAKKEFTLETITRTASIVKSLTAIAVMQLYEQNLVGLDLPIQTYIPNFPRKSKGEITVRQLLSHASGIPGYGSVKEAQTKKHFNNLNEAMNVFKDRDLLTKPGSEFNYTTYGYVVLGVLIENVSAMSYEDYIQKNVLDKAGMAHTGIEKYNQRYANKSTLYHRNKKGKIKEATANNLSNRIPGGGFYTTLGDMLKFGEAVLDNSLIKEETLAMMIENTGLKKEGNPYGLGWFLYGGKTQPSAAFGHSGEQTGASTQFIIVPKRKTVIVVLANTSGSWNHALGMCVQLANLSKNMHQEID